MACHSVLLCSCDWREGQVLWPLLCLSLPRSMGFFVKVESDILALGPDGAAFPILTAFVLSQPVGSEPRKSESFPAEKLWGTVAQDLGTPDASSPSHSILWLHCEITCMHVCSPANPSAHCLEEGSRKTSSVWKRGLWSTAGAV